MDIFRKRVLVEFENKDGYGFFNRERAQTIDTLKRAAFPNLLAELVYSARFSLQGVAKAGNISEWILLDVLRGDDTLEWEEKYSISCLFHKSCGYGSMGYLFHPELNCYDLSNPKHRRKVRAIMVRLADKFDYLATLKRAGNLPKCLESCYTDITQCGILSRPKEAYKSGVFLRAEYNLMAEFIERVSTAEREILAASTKIKRSEPPQRKPLRKTRISA